MPATERIPTARQQYRGARSELLVSLAYMGVPWAVFLLLTIAGNVLRLAFGHYEYMTVPVVALCGTALAAFDWHLRGHRTTAVGRVIGPVTAEAATVMTVIYLLAGFSPQLALAWISGGGLACSAWDIWLHRAAHHDMAQALSLAAEGAGLGPAMVRPSRRRKAVTAGPARPALPAGQAPPLPARQAAPAPRRMTGRIRFEESTPDDAAAAVTRMEAGMHWPPGAMAVAPSSDDAGTADYTVTDPGLLAAPLPWPGPSAPGATLAEPLRLGMRQDGLEFWYYLLALHHVRASGGTGSGKTMSWLWNFYAEAVTREGFAGFVMDSFKGLQFAGPLAPALHGLDVTPRQVLDRMLALRRARKARLGYLAARHMTEWAPGCGLSLVDAWVEEASSTLREVMELAKGLPGRPLTTADWVDGTRGDRSAGIRWDVSMQLGKGSPEFPTEARGQFGTLCFGTADKGESRIGLSESQRAAGARPEMWKDKFPGKAYLDAKTTAPGDEAMPVRFWSWGRSAEAVAGYMSEWPASERPLDEVTAEAMASVPPLPDSYFPPAAAAGQHLATGRPDPRDAARDRGGQPANVRQLFRGQQPPAVPDRTAAADAALEVVRAELAARYAAGKELFTFDDLTKAGLWPGYPATGPGGRTNRARPWGYRALTDAVNLGWTEEVTGGRKRWRILPAVNDVPGQEQA